ncbi:MAG: CpaF family protein [Anaerolineales bacterium]|jgi:pilus assembly protein CpaF
MTSRTAVPPTSTLGPDELERLLSWLKDQVTGNLDASLPPGYAREVAASEILAQVYSRTRLNLSDTKRDEILSRVMRELFGLGPLQGLLNDPTVTEIMVNGPKSIFIERHGTVSPAPVSFEKEEQLQGVIDRILLPLGLAASNENPLCEARLPDGSRVTVAIAPVAVSGPYLSIRKFMRERLTLENLVALATLTPNITELLRSCVRARLNLLVSGGPAAGKTTLLNGLAGSVPEAERVIIVEEAAELYLVLPNVVRLEGRMAGPQGKGGVSSASLLRGALRMRPDRIIVGEIRGEEALELLHAINMGHDGSLMTIQANSPREALARFETFAQMAGSDLPTRVLRERITSAVDVVIQLSRLHDGSRKITSVCEVAGMEGEQVMITELFKFLEEGRNPQGKVTGQLRATGMRPVFAGRLEEAGYRMPTVIGLSSSEGRPLSPGKM